MTTETTANAVNYSLRQLEAHLGRPLTYPATVTQMVTIATSSGYLCTHDHLQAAMKAGVVAKPENCGHVSDRLFSADDVRAILTYLEEQQAWSPLASKHDHKRDFADLRETRALRKRIITIKESCDALNPVEVLDVMFGEANLWNRYAMWISIRAHFQVLQDQMVNASGQ